MKMGAERGNPLWKRVSEVVGGMAYLNNILT
jgi:hypothetical protein